MSYFALLRAHPRTIAFGFIHAVTATAGQTFVIGLYLPEIMAALRLDPAQAAGLFAVTTIASAIALWRFGRAIDHIDLLRYSACSALVLGGGCMLAAASTSLAVFTLALFAMRLGGNGLLNHIALTATARHFVSDRGKALAVVSLGFASEAAVGVAAVYLIDVWGWRAALGATGACVIVTVVACGALVRRNPGYRSAHHVAIALAERHARSSAPEPRRVARARYFVMTAPLFVAPMLIMTALVFHQGVIAQAKGMSLHWFAVSFTGFALSRVIGSLVVGPLVDRYGPDRLFGLHLVPFGAGLAVLAISTQAWAVPLYWMLTGTTGGLMATLQSAVVAERIEPHRLGRVRSMLAAVAILSAAAGPALYGQLIAWGIPIPALLWASVGAVGVATALGIVGGAGEPSRPRRRTPEEQEAV